MNGGMLLVGTVVPIYQCPSDGSNRIITTGAGSLPAAQRKCQPSNYYPSMGPTLSISNSGSCSCPLYSTFKSYSRTATDANKPAGMFTRNGWNFMCRMAEVEDGLSNTIMVGEVRPKCSNHVRQGWSRSNKWGAFTQIPINFDSCRTKAEADAEGKDYCYADCNWNSEVGFKSLHPNGAQFVLGDGSVKFLTQTIDLWTYQYLGDKADKKAFSMP
jgi:hypothetical protein